MAISFIAAGAFATGTSPSVPPPAGISEGDTLVLFFTGQTSPSTPSGWSQLVSQGTGRYLSIWTRIATASETNATISTSSDATARAVMLAYSGVAFASGTSSTVRTGTSFSAVTNTFTPTGSTGSDFYVISTFAADDSNANSWTTPASTNLRASANTTTTINGMLIVDESFAGGTTTARTTTLSSSNPWATVAIALYSARDLYWVGGTGDWTTATNWSLTSGGSGNASQPLSRDTSVTIDNNSGTGTITATVTGLFLYAPNFTVTATQALNLNIVYDPTVSSFGYLASTNATFPSSGSFTITASGYENPSFSSVNGAGGLGVSGTLTANNTVIPVLQIQGATTLGSNLTVDGPIYHNTGTFDTSSSGNYSVTALQYGLFQISGNPTRTLSLNASTFTVTGTTEGQLTSFYVASATNVTINAGTSTINCSNTISTFSGNGFTYYNVAFTNSDITSAGISGACTFNNLTVTSRTTTGKASVALNASQTVNGTLTLGSANSATKRIQVQSSTAGTTRTITAAAVATLSDVDFRDITAAGASGTWSGTRLGNALGNSNITFDAGKTVYWNLSGTQNWSSTGWATTNNGTPAANNFPLAQDTAVFTEAGSAGTITLDADWNVGTLTMADGVSNRTTAFTLAGTSSLFLYGDLTLFSSLSLTSTGSWNFYGAGVTQNLNFAGVTIPGTFNTANTSGTVTLLSDLISSGSSNSNITRGTFDANDYDVTCFGVSSSSGTAIMGSGTWTLSGTGPLWSYTSTSSVTAETSTIVLSDTSTTARTFAGNGLTYNDLVIGGSTGSSTLTITGNNTFGEVSSTKTVAHTITFSGNQTIGTWAVTGSTGNIVTVNSNTVGTQRSLAITNKTSNIDYLSITDINSTGLDPVTFWAGANSTNNGNNTGIAFENGSSYSASIITSGTTWTAPADWNSTSNKIYLIGGGGGGSGSGTGASIVRECGGGGGGGGAYTELTDVTLTPSSSYTIAIGAGGTAGTLIAGADAISTAGSGGQTTLTIGGTTYTANGGSGGGIKTSTTIYSVGGNGGAAQSISGLITAAYAGGNGGAGGTTTAGNNTWGGGGGGAGGPNGIGGAGGAGITSSGSAGQAGGGGGNGGGSAGGIGLSGYGGGAGGNNFDGIGGGAAVSVASVGNPGTFGGGGSGTASTVSSGSLPNGGNGVDILGGVGGGGGAGGSGGFNQGANGGLYGAGGSGAGTVNQNEFDGGAGAQGVIIVVYDLGGVIYSGTVTENSGLADILSALGIFNSANTEATTMAESEAATSIFTRSATENTVLDDDETAQLSMSSAATENTTLADTESGQAVFTSAATEPSTLVDSELAQTAFNSSRTENTTLASSEAVQAVFNGAISESTQIADINGAVLVFNVLVTEASILDNIQAYINVITSTITENVDLASDEQAGSIYLVTITEAQTSDNTQSVVAIFSAIDTENTTVANTQVAQADFNSTNTEGTTVADAQTVQANFNSAASENTTVAENQITIKALNAAAVENSSIAGVQAANFVYQVTSIEGLSAADAIAVQGIFASIASEGLSISDFLVGYGWFTVVDSQTITWTNVNDSQSITWTNVNDAQSPGWSIVNDSQGD